MAFEPQKTSFIPKQAMVKTPQPVRSVGWPTALAMFLAVAAILVYGGLFMYQSILKNDIKNLSVSLDRAKGAFETNLIAELQIIDARLSTGGMLLKQHSAMSPLFSLLEEKTVQTLRYKNFALKTIGDGMY